MKGALLECALGALLFFTLSFWHFLAFIIGLAAGALLFKYIKDVKRG